MPPGRKKSERQVKDEAGKTIGTGVPVNDPKDRKQLVVSLPAPLKAGHYTITWHAVSEDSHRVKGEYSFGGQLRLPAYTSSQISIAGGDGTTYAAYEGTFPL